MKEDFKLDLNGKELGVKINDLAGRTNGSCLVRYGDTVVMATAVMGGEREGQDFFPLTVDYQEKFYAAGKILGSRFMRRENRPSDEAILTARLIDRIIRPRFPKGFKKDVQVIITCLSWDGENDPDILGIISASIALSISDIPWNGPTAALRIGKKEGKEDFILNPTYEEREGSNLDLVFATAPSSKKSSDLLINMIEAEGKEVDEELICQAHQWSLPYFKKLFDFQNQIIQKSAKEKVKAEEPVKEEELESEIKEFLSGKMEKAIYEAKDMEGVDELRETLVLSIEEKYSEDPDKEDKIRYALNFFEEDLDKTIRNNIIQKPSGGERRPDGRKIDEVRPISCDVSFLPRTHGSAVFQRGETKSLSILTLGSPRDSKLIEGMEFIGKKRFMHHYNFPPYSVGEVRPLRGTGRREIGHGMLAEKALANLIPNEDDFPYTLRIVSEILSSNGSSSMASVSSSSLALMDAGVPIKRLATGIALGLVTDPEEASVSESFEKNKYRILTDIQGPEDHYGDMDFKVAGTKEGITAIQMDVKIAGINEKILKEALKRAKEARLHILEKMEQIISKPRESLSPWAPRIYIIQINPKKIGEVIGSGGKTINEIIEKCGVAVEIEDSGKVFITAEKEESAQKAITWIENITREVQVGEVFQGKVKRVVDFGAFVEVLPGQEGLVHISRLAPFHVKKVEDIIKVGDTIPVKVISIDEQGRINLSAKEIEPEKK